MRTQDAYGARRWISRTPRLMRPQLIAGAAEAAMQHEGPRRGERRRIVTVLAAKAMKHATTLSGRCSPDTATAEDLRRCSPLRLVSHERYLQGAFWLKIEAVASDGIRLMR